MKKLLILLFFLISSTFIYSQLNKDSLSSKLLEVTKSKDLYDNFISVEILGRNSEYGRYSDFVGNFIFKYFNFDSIKANFINIYSEEFTADELSELINFYKTPLGEKLISRSPLIYAKISRFEEEKMNKMTPILDSLLFEEFKNYVHDHPTVLYDSVYKKSIYAIKDSDTSFTDNLNCAESKKFHEGKYITKGDTCGFVIIRKNNFQSEINNNLNYDCEYKIEWIDECDYNLTLIRNKSKNNCY